MPENKLTYNKLINFSNILDSHILTSQCFFDSEFLNLMETHLSYNTCSFVVYESNRTYKESVGHNVPMAKDYEDGYKDKDPLAKYISNNYDNIISSGCKVVRASDAFSNYDNCEFHHILNTFSAVDYAAVILFDNLRLTLYKTYAEGDFTDEEIHLLDILGDIITSRYILFSKITKPSLDHTLEELKNMYFDTLSTGVIILNKQFELLDCNNMGHEYISELAPSLSITSYFSNLIPLLNFSPLSDPSSHVDRIAKFDDFIINIKLYHNSGTSDDSDDAVYFITITNKSNDIDDEHSTPNDGMEMRTAFANKYSLSPREMDIVVSLSNGQKYQDIADSLFISINTVRTHVKNIYRKLDINNQRSLLYIYNQFPHD